MSLALHLSQGIRLVLAKAKNYTECMTVIHIPPHKLQSETLSRLIEEYVTRQSANGGADETPLAERVKQVRSLLSSGKAVIVFDQESGSANIVHREAVDDVADEML